MLESVEAPRQENSLLREELSQERRERGELAKKVDILTEQIPWFKNRFLSRSSEKLSAEERAQMRLFDQADAAQEGPADAEEPPIEVVADRRARPRRRPLPESFPREEALIDIPEEQKV